MRHFLGVLDQTFFVQRLRHHSVLIFRMCNAGNINENNEKFGEIFLNCVGIFYSLTINTRRWGFRS